MKESVVLIFLLTAPFDLLSLSELILWYLIFTPGVYVVVFLLVFYTLMTSFGLSGGKS